MSLFETDLQGGRQWGRVGDGYELTKKPRGLNLSTFPEIPFAKMEAIPQDGSYLPKYAMKAPSSIGGGTYFERGDVLVAKITPSFENGKQALITDLITPFGYATTEVIPLHAISTEHDPRFLFFYLLHPEVRLYVAGRMEGSTGRLRVPEALLLDLPIPALKRDEQSAIANALQLVQRASAQETMCERVAQALKRTAMQELFTRGLCDESRKETEIGTVPESWKLTPIASLGRIVTGNTPPTNDASNYIGGDIAFIAPGDIEHGSVIRGTEKRITDKGLKSIRPIESGATCFVCIGSSIGKVGYVTWPVCATNQQINSVVPNSAFHPPFVFYLLTYWADHVRRHASPSPVPILSKGAFERVEVYTSVYNQEQIEIANILQAIDQKIEIHRRKRALLDDLFESLLHKLITGEIRIGDLNLSAIEPTPATESGA